MSLTTLLNDTIDIQSKTRTGTTTGGWTEVWADVYSSVPCRLQPLSADEVKQWDKPAGTVMAKCYVETGSMTILTSYRVSHTSGVWNIRGERDFDMQGRLTVLHLEMVEPEN